MPLKPCRECGHQVSMEAVNCPSCGAPQPVVTEADLHAARFAACSDEELRRVAQEDPPTIPLERAALAAELRRRSDARRRGVVRPTPTATVRPAESSINKGSGRGWFQPRLLAALTLATVGATAGAAWFGTQSSEPAIAHSLLETEVIRPGEEGAYRLRVRVYAYPSDAAALRRVGEAVVREFTRVTPACVVHLHFYGPETNTAFMADVGNLRWAPTSGLGLADCRQTPRGQNAWSVEFLGARPTVTSALRLGTAMHAGVVPLPVGARHVREFKNSNGVYGTYALPGATEDDILSLYRVEMPKRGWEITGLSAIPHNVAFMKGRALGVIEWKLDTITVGYESSGAPEP